VAARKLMMKRTTTLCLFVFAACAGCSFTARAPEQYRDDTRALLETRQAQIKQCYDDALKQDAKLAGQVTVQFTVQSETGKIMNPKVDPAHTTAPDSLGQCVVSALDGLALAPPDARDGQATFVYQFTASGGASGAEPAQGAPGAPIAPPGAPAAPAGPVVPGAPGLPPG
jgi:hypothetical protein